MQLRFVAEDQSGDTYVEAGLDDVLITGSAVDGPLVGRSLTPVLHWNHFWFAWFAFKPETVVIRR